MADLIRLAGSTLDRSRHVCAFFHGREEEYRVLLPFIKEGIDRGERAIHVVAERVGQLEIRTWETVYLRDGQFDRARCSSSSPTR